MIRHLSSDSLRTALGYESFLTLQNDARAEDRSLNAFCLSILRRQLEANGHSGAAWLPGFEAENPIAFDPIQATFNGGHHEPLHEWYPWLEGYSPAFVESVIGSYCPNAKTVCDPFGGAGTTPLTASRLGKKAYYTEINPVLQFLTASKVIALQLHDRERAELANELTLRLQTRWMIGLMRRGRIPNCDRPTMRHLAAATFLKPMCLRRCCAPGR